MAHGGARNRSGPPASESSARSDRRGYTLTALPSEGFQGDVPSFPLPDVTDRELEVWEWAWRTPQACAWSLPSEMWRVRFVAEWVRLSVRSEAADASASLMAPRMRLEDRIGLSTAGLAEMGWKIAVDEVGAKRDQQPTVEPARKSSRSKLTVVKAATGDA